MGLSHPLQSSVSNLIQLPACSTGFETPNIISQRHNQCSRPFPCSNRSLYPNGIEQLTYGLRHINKEKGGGSTVGLQRVASRPKFKRVESPGIPFTTMNQSGYNSSNGPQTSVPTRLRFQNQPVTQRDNFESLQDFLASIDSSEPSTFHDFSQPHGNNSSSNAQVHVQPQVLDQSLPLLDVYQNTFQSGNPTTGATNSNLLDSDFNWFCATSDSIAQHASVPDPVLLPSVQPSDSGPLAISQHHSNSPESWVYSVDHQPVPGISTDPALSELGFVPLEPPMVDPAMILYELGLAANGV